jgi:hypothetical protein
MDLRKIQSFHERWMLAEFWIGLVAFVVCANFRRKPWIWPIWSLFVLATGLHTLALVFMIFAAGSGGADAGWAGLAVMISLMTSWPVSLTFVALLFAYPRKRRPGEPHPNAESD